MTWSHQWLPVWCTFSNRKEEITREKHRSVFRRSTLGRSFLAPKPSQRAMLSADFFLVPSLLAQDTLVSLLKAAKYEIQKPSTCRATLFRCKFSSMFPVFHLAWSTWTATKTFVGGWRNAARWLVDFPSHEQICCATSCEFDEKRATKPKFVAQSRPALYFSQQLSSTRNKCFCCATIWSRKVKNGKHRRKLATKQYCATSWRFLYLVFRRLKEILAVFHSYLKVAP